MKLEGNSNAVTSAAFLLQLRERNSGPLQVIWDNAPAHRGEAVRDFLATPCLGLRSVNLPGYSPDFNADEAVWGWAREEATGNLCLGTKALVRRGSTTSSAGWPAGETKSNGAAGPSCSLGPQGSCETHNPTPDIPKMHIPPWL